MLAIAAALAGGVAYAHDIPVPCIEEPPVTLAERLNGIWQSSGSQGRVLYAREIKEISDGMDGDVCSTLILTTKGRIRVKFREFLPEEDRETIVLEVLSAVPLH